MRMIKLFVAFCFMLSASAAIAGGPNGPGERVLNNWSGYAWYQGTGSGMIHERWACDTNFENCSGHWKYYPEEKWADGPDYCERELDYGYLGDVGDGSDILPPGFYYVCVMEGPTFRFKP